MTYEKNVTKKALITGQDGSYYPLPVHLQPAYLKQGHGECLCRSQSKLRVKIVLLPMYPELTREQIEFVA